MKTETLSFAQLGLSEHVLAAVADMGYDTPTPVQAQAIPAVLAGHDVMAAAQTGTGKTAAFLLPTLDRLGHTRRGSGPLMLVVTPTRELAQQIEAVAKAVCAHTRHSCAVVVGGVGYEPQKAALARGCDVLVATPGRLIDLMDQGACSLGDVRVLVLDEADRMLDMGFAPAMRRIVGKTPSNRQTLLFSATLGEEVLSTTRDLISNPVRVEIAHKGTAAQTIDQYLLGVAEKGKVPALIQVLKQEGTRRVIVFCRGKHRADMVCRKLAKAGIAAAPIHGNRSQNQREAALRRFASGEADVLVATDVLARGIDISEVSYVVNLDVPGDAEDYIHRIGRTGRAGEYGWALTFVSEDEYLDLRDIEQLMGKLIPDFPRADGIDCGEGAFVPDPRRKPTDQLPSAKARKKMKAAREAARAETAEKAASASKTPAAKAVRAGRGEGVGKDRVSTSARAAAPEKQEPHVEKKSGAEGNAASRRRNRQVRQSQGAQESPKTQGDARRNGARNVAGGDGKMKRVASRPATQMPADTSGNALAPSTPRRRPGDHGGAGSAKQRGIYR